ncbi:MAG TPA: helix-turn-helix domain-containing protein, partial [Epsilonproteobacteria bacterium]|nr:helix-turn-helix domain-containing protein [Campylobacterota bacterium]
GVVLDLTRAEYEILTLFIAQSGRVIRREEIAHCMESHRFESGIESIGVLVGRLRRKITDEKSQYIETVRGLGYRFES